MKLQSILLFMVLGFLAPKTVLAEASALKPAVLALQNPTPRRVLFIGNSYLYYNDSLHNHVHRMAKESWPELADEFRFKSATIGGASLAQHPVEQLLEPGRLGVSPAFDLVVLQGGSGEVSSRKRQQAFAKTARRFKQKIEATGAETALYMIHAYVKPHPHAAADMTNRAAEIYTQTGNSINALVLPVGLAFERAYAEQPDIKLHKAFDGTHPSLLGTYLAACVVYRSIYSKPAQNLAYDYFGAVAKEDAIFLRRIADETVKLYFKR